MGTRSPPTPHLLPTCILPGKFVPLPTLKSVPTLMPQVPRDVGERKLLIKLQLWQLVNQVEHAPISVAA